MEGYHLTEIRLSAPSMPVAQHGGGLVVKEVGDNGQKIPRGELPMIGQETVSMPVGTIFLNYIPDREWPYSYIGTLYCLVPDWQVKEG